MTRTTYCPNCRTEVEPETTSNPNPGNPRVALVQEYCPECDGVL